MPPNIPWTETHIVCQHHGLTSIYFNSLLDRLRSSWPPHSRPPRYHRPNVLGYRSWSRRQRCPLRSHPSGRQARSTHHEQGMAGSLQPNPYRESLLLPFNSCLHANQSVGTKSRPHHRYHLGVLQGPRYGPVSSQGLSTFCESLFNNTIPLLVFLCGRARVGLTEASHRVYMI